MGDLLNQVYVKCVQKEQHSIVSHCVLPLNDEIALFFKGRFVNNFFSCQISTTNFNFRGKKKNPEQVAFFLMTFQFSQSCIFHQKTYQYISNTQEWDLFSF